MIGDFLKSNKITAIDIGQSSVKLVQLKKKKNIVQLLTVDQEELPFELMKEEDNNQIVLISSALNNLFKRNNLKGNNIVTGLASRNIIVRNIDIPYMEKEKIKESLKFEVANCLPYDVSDPTREIVFDYIVIDSDEKRLYLLLIVAKRMIVEDFLSIFDQINCDSPSISIKPMALLNVLDYQGKLDNPVAIFDIGAQQTEIIIADSSNIYVSRNTDVGGVDFTEAIKEDMDITFHEAESVKIKEGLNIQGKENEMEDDFDIDLMMKLNNTDVFQKNDNLTIVAEDLVTEMIRSLEYFVNKNDKGKELSKVYLTGGSSQLIGLDDMLRKEVDIEVEHINPSLNIEKKNKNKEQNLNRFTTSIGLGLGELFKNDK